jgi:hypothetical protein
VPAARLIYLRYSARCTLCLRPVDAGSRAWWDGVRRSVTCSACAASPGRVPSGVAGGSARAEGQQQRAAQVERRRALKLQRPILGRFQIALAGPPKHGDSWLTGAVGEERFGAALDAMTSRGLLVLHDRRRPRTAANIDHLVIGPTGIWVVDTKRYKGLVAKVDRGGLLHPDVRLTVGGRDRTALVEGVQRQVVDVRAAIACGPLPQVPVTGALCFVDSEFPRWTRPWRVGGVLVSWGKPIRRRMVSRGPLDRHSRELLHRLLASQFPPASRS